MVSVETPGIVEALIVEHATDGVTMVVLDTADTRPWRPGDVELVTAGLDTGATVHLLIRRGLPHAGLAAQIEEIAATHYGDDTRPTVGAVDVSGFLGWSLVQHVERALGVEEGDA